MTTHNRHTPATEPLPNSEVLVGYLNNTLDDSSKRALEEMFAEDDLLGDAIEGLKQLKDGKEAAAINTQLNRMIQTKISKRRIKKLPSISFPLWMLLLITTLLLLMLAGYVIISKLP